MWKAPQQWRLAGISEGLHLGADREHTLEGEDCGSLCQRMTHSPTTHRFSLWCGGQEAKDLSEPAVLTVQQLPRPRRAAERPTAWLLSEVSISQLCACSPDF